jgi:hypothetical protein
VNNKKKASQLGMPKNKEEEIVMFLQSFETFYEIFIFGFAFNLDLSPFSPTATKLVQRFQHDS